MPSVTVRYIVDDVDAAIAFYADRLGFEEVMHPAPTFAMLVRGELRLVLSRPSSAPGGGQVVGDRVPRPGGWNRFALEVDDVDAAFTELRRHDVAFRGPIVDGVGGRQVIAEDPSGNPVELFQPTIPEARLDARSARHHRSGLQPFELLQVSPAEAREARGTGARDAQADDTPVLGVAGPTDQARARRPVHEARRTVVLEEQRIGDVADGGPALVVVPAHGEQQLVLSRREALLTGLLLAPLEEPPQLRAEPEQAADSRRR